jgi:chromosome partitioning protein
VDLVGTVEIAERLGLAYPETVHNWRKRYEDFPEPIATVSGTLVWEWADVEAWARATGRVG